MTMTVSGFRRITTMPSSSRPQHRKLTGKPCRPAAANARLRRGSPGSEICSSRNISLTPTAAFVFPVRQDLIHRGIGRIDRLHDPEPLRIPGIDLERIARVIAVEVEGGDDDRGIDADRVHGRYHFLAGSRCRAVQLSGPRPTGMVAFVGV